MNTPKLKLHPLDKDIDRYQQIWFKSIWCSSPSLVREQSPYPTVWSHHQYMISFLFDYKVIINFSTCAPCEVLTAFGYVCVWSWNVLTRKFSPWCIMSIEIHKIKEVIRCSSLFEPTKFLFSGEILNKKYVHCRQLIWCPWFPWSFDITNENCQGMFRNEILGDSSRIEGGEVER